MRQDLIVVHSQVRSVGGKLFNVHSRPLWEICQAYLARLYTYIERVSMQNKCAPGAFSVLSVNDQKRYKKSLGVTLF